MAYVYRHIRLDKNEPFYIGIGSDENYFRAFRKRRENNRYWQNITNKVNYEVEIMMDNLTWEQACEKEIEFIKLYGRSDLGLGTLVNLTDGGEGQLGQNVSKEFRHKIAITHGKPVGQYDLDGRFIKSYPSCIEAARQLEVSNPPICWCANGAHGTITAYGFVWRWYNGNNSDIVFDRNAYYDNMKNKIKVAVYDKEGNFIKVYKSLHEAARELKSDVKKISQAVTNKIMSSGGLMFKKYDGSTENIIPPDFYKNTRGQNHGVAGENHPMYGRKGINNPLSKPINQIDFKTDKIIKTFSCAKEAGIELGFDSSSISKCCKGIYPQVRGFKWAFVNKNKQCQKAEK